MANKLDRILKRKRRIKKLVSDVAMSRPDFIFEVVMSWPYVTWLFIISIYVFFHFLHVWFDEGIFNGFHAKIFLFFIETNNAMEGWNGIQKAKSVKHKIPPWTEGTRKRNYPIIQWKSPDSLCYYHAWHRLYFWMGGYGTLRNDPKWYTILLESSLDIYIDISKHESRSKNTSPLGRLQCRLEVEVVQAISRPLTFVITSFYVRLRSKSSKCWLVIGIRILFFHS